MFQIDKHGDILEKTYADLIHERLAGYEKIWASFIGNDSTRRMPEVPELDDAEQRIRGLFSQYHYTCLESIICMKELVNKVKSYSIHTLDSKDKLLDYIQLMSDYMAFHAHAGRIRDLVIKMGALYRIGDLGNALNEYFQRRNIVLHESKAPIEFIEGVVSILVPVGEKEERTEWHREKLWTEDTNTSIEFIPDYLDDTLNEILTILNNILEKLYSRTIAQIVKDRGINITPTSDAYDDYGVSASGTSDSSLR